MKKCEVCQKEVDESFGKCPYCATETVESAHTDSSVISMDGSDVPEEEIPDVTAENYSVPHTKSFCKYCGNEIVNNDDYCKQCGRYL